MVLARQPDLLAPVSRMASVLRAVPLWRGSGGPARCHIRSCDRKRGPGRQQLGAVVCSRIRFKSRVTDGSVASGRSDAGFRIQDQNQDWKRGQGHGYELKTCAAGQKPRPETESGIGSPTKSSVLRSLDALSGTGQGTPSANKVSGVSLIGVPN